MSRSEKIDMDKLTEALLPYSREARINGKWVKGGRYDACRREYIEWAILVALYVGFIAFQAVVIITQVARLMR